MIHFAVFLLFLSLNTPSEEVKFPWVVYYGDQAPVEAFDPYNPIVLDSKSHPPLKPLLDKKKEVLGYLNLAETSQEDAWFQSIKDKQLLIKENPSWPGSWSINIRDPYWENFLIEKIIPGILSQGFTGLFLDQLDVSLDLEKQDPEKYKGMTAAAIHLVHTIHKQFGKRIMMNRAYEILPQVGEDIDYELAETLYTSYHFETKQYYVRPKAEFEWQLQQLNSARRLFPHLVIFSLDYWDPKDKEMYKKIYAIERKNCVRPYVSAIVLGEFVPGEFPQDVPQKENKDDKSKP